MTKMIAIILLASLTASASSQSCVGTETFEKVTGVTLDSVSQSAFFASIGNAVTAECNNR